LELSELFLACYLSTLLYNWVQIALVGFAALSATCPKPQREGVRYENKPLPWPAVFDHKALQSPITEEIVLRRYF
jgi:hypothetical protein